LPSGGSVLESSVGIETESSTEIGAYYDREVQEFLGTEKKVLYAFAIGR